MPICKNCHTRIDKFNSDRCPICGVPFFYIYKKREGIISCLINVILLTLAIVLTAVFTNIHVALVIVMYLFAFIALNAFIGLYLYNMPNLKDGRGDFLN